MADYARAERLRGLREARHLSRERAAMEIDVSAKTLYAWEHGSKIKWENVKRAAAFYGVDPETLVSREIEPVPAPELNQLERIEQKLDLLVAQLVPDAAQEAAEALEAAPEPDTSRRANTAPNRAGRARQRKAS